MDTKLKGWTAVRIICFILILILCFTALNRFTSALVTHENTRIQPGIVFADLSTNSHFFEYHPDTHMIYHNLAILAQLRSEEAIRNGEHLVWFEFVEGYFQDHQDHFGWDFFLAHEIPFDINRFFADNSDSTQTLPSIDLDEFAPERDRLFTSDFDYDTIVEVERDNEDFVITEKRLHLRSIDGHRFYTSIPLTDQTTLDELNRHEANAIRSQLHLFQTAQENLDQFEGLLYYMGIEARTADEADMSLVIFSNVDENLQNAEYFSSYPFYITMPFHFSDYDLSSDAYIYLAFTPEVANAQTQINSTARNAYIRDFTTSAFSTILALGLTIVLMVAAGRKYKVTEGEVTQTKNVHFIAIDKPYLDISLAVLIGFTTLVSFLAFGTFQNVWQHGHMNTIALNLILLFAVLLVVPLVLVWLTSLAKRIRAGKFWEHTLIHTIISKCIFRSIRFTFRSVKSLWAGRTLSIKASVISIAVFFTLLFVGLLSFGNSNNFAAGFVATLLITFAISYLVHRYASRIHKLEKGAHLISEGNYETPIEVGGGELGGIANSINNISAGINKAVDERMKSERLKTELITNVSHDIRTPLTSIITYSDLLKNEGLDSEKAPEYLDVLIQKSQRLKTLTDELFEASKAATGNIKTHIEILDSVALINQVLGELDNAIKSSGLDLRINMPEHLYIKADGRLMQRVIENLVNNALKYSMPTSRIYLDARKSNDNAYALIELKNISATELNFDPTELTERFKRGDNSRADGGSGLGLSIVQSFTNIQNGEFTIEIDGDLFKAIAKLPLADKV